MRRPTKTHPDAKGPVAFLPWRVAVVAPDPYGDGSGYHPVSVKTALMTREGSLVAQMVTTVTSLSLAIRRMSVHQTALALRTHPPGQRHDPGSTARRQLLGSDMEQTSNTSMRIPTALRDDASYANTAASVRQSTQVSLADGHIGRPSRRRPPTGSASSPAIQRTCDGWPETVTSPSSPSSPSEPRASLRESSARS
jgi:hypothetical protein